MHRSGPTSFVGFVLRSSGGLIYVVLTRPDAGWFLTLYPDAGEAGGSFRSSMRAPSTYVPPGYAKDPERARVEAGRRARGSCVGTAPRIV